MRSTSQNEHLEAKLSIENMYHKNVHKIQSWHADNVRYAEKDFREAVSLSDQTITFVV